MRYLLEKLPAAETVDEVEALLPHVLKPTDIAIMPGNTISPEAASAAA